MTSSFSVDALRDLGLAVFAASGVCVKNAAEVVDALVEAELEGIASHGFSRIPAYADQALSGKIQGNAAPVVTLSKPAAVMVDACNGFAFPAINAGLRTAFVQVKTQGMCCLGITRSHHCGVLGHFVEKIAEAGYVGIAFANTPAAMAPWGGKQACFGTNPLAFACPRKDAQPLVADLSLSKVARGKVMLAKQQGTKIPDDWALDGEGNPTTDPEAALKGTMLPLGDAKGAVLALMVEILAASLTGANHSFEASSFFDAKGTPPGVGQFFILIDPVALNPHFLQQVEVLFHAILDQGNTRLPGARRKEARAQHVRDGVVLPEKLVEELRKRAATKE